MTLYSGTPTTLVAGDTSALVTKFNDHRDALKALSEAPTAYTPTYAGISAIGNAVVVAQYHRVDKWIEGDVKIVMGSGTTFAATTFLIGLPVAIQAGLAANHCVGAGFLLDNTTSTSRTVCSAITATSTTVFLVPGGSPGGTVTDAVPWTWATSDTLSFQFRYPAA